MTTTKTAPSSTTATNGSSRNGHSGKAVAPNVLSTPTDLNAEGVQEIVAAINPLVADAFALYVKTKNFHWHLASSHFRDYHLMLDEQADQIFATIDPLAERVRKIGGTTIRSIGHIASLQTTKDANEDFVLPIEMLSRLMEDNKSMAAHMRHAHEICDDHKDVATASLLENFIDETERRTWFLFEVAQGGEHHTE